MAHKFLRIGDLAKATGSKVETIRYYEREGLLPAPTRSDANYRLYGEAHVHRLKFIRHCRSLDMTLDEIHQLLAFRDAPDENCAVVNTLLDRHIGHVVQRIAELQGLEKQLRVLRRQCRKVRSIKNCGIMQNLSDGSSSALAGAGISRGCH